jgi:NDP-sugar pyrophosphorylase family protein
MGAALTPHGSRPSQGVGRAMIREATDRDNPQSPGTRDESGSRAPQFDRGKVRGIVLAGVHAWGDCVLERAVCRPLLPVADRPLVAHALEWVRSAGVSEATVCGNSDTARIRQRMGDGKKWGIAIDYFEDVMPRGPAGCVRDAALASDADTFIVVDGTIVPRVDLGELIAAHQATQAAVTIVVGRPEEISGSADGDLEPVGIYVLDRRVMQEIPPTGYQDIKECLVPMLYQRGVPVAIHVVPGAQAPRVTDAASYLGVNMWTVERKVQDDRSFDDLVRVDDAWVHPSAQVDPSVRFVGPVLVGPNCRVGANVLVVGPTTIGTGTVIREGAVVTRSALWDYCTVGVDAIIDQCVLTDRAEIEGEIVVRETVCVAPQRSTPRMMGRLASWFTAGGDDRSSPAMPTKP